MSTTNYWNMDSGDSQASTWNTDNWSKVPGTNPWMGGSTKGTIDPNNIMGEGINPATGNQWMMGDTTQYAGGSKNFWEGAGQGFMQQMNNDTQHADTRYGAATTPGTEGYWSGGRPGAGSWMEAMSAPVATPVAAAPVAAPMAQAAPVQRTPAIADTYVPPNPQLSTWEQDYRINPFNSGGATKFPNGYTSPYSIRAY